MASNRIKGITIEVGGDTSKLVKALSSVDNSIKNTQTNINDLNRALKLDPGNTELLRDKQQELAQQIEDTKKKLETEKTALEQLRNTEGFDAASRQAQNLKTQIDLDTAALEELERQAKESGSVLGTQMQVAGEKIEAVGSKIKGVGDKLEGIGQTLTTKITAPIMAAFGGSVKAAMDWETAFTGVKKTVDGTEEEYNQLADAIKNMATETASSKEDIAGVMEVSGQLGVSGVQNLIDFTRTMVMLGDTTNMSAEDAATSLARFMNITGESYTDASKLGSVVVDLGNNFATTESEIVEMATRLAAAGTIAGLSSTDILALSASMSSVGINAEAGGTAMTQTLTAIGKAVDAQDEKLETMAKVSGMTAEQFTQTWQTEPIQAVNSFITGLSNMGEESESTIQILQDLNMSGVRQANMLQSLALASDQLTSATETAGQAYVDNSALEEEAAKRYETMAAKVNQLKERFTNIAVEIGERLMPYVEKLMDFLDGLIEKWDGLDDAEKDQIIQIAAVVAAIGPALLVIGKLVSTVGTLTSGFGNMTSTLGKVVTSLSGATSGTGALSGALGALASPVGIVLGVLAALAAAFVYLYKTNDEFAASMDEKWAEIKAAVSQAWEHIKPALQSLKDTFTDLMRTLEPVFRFLFEQLGDFVIIVVNTVGPIVESIAFLAESFSEKIAAINSLIHGDFKGAMEHMQKSAEAKNKATGKAFEALGETVKGVLQSMGVDTDDLERRFDGFASDVSRGWSKLKDDARTKWSSIHDSVTSKAGDARDKASEYFGDMWDKISTNVGGIRDTIEEKIGEAMDFLKDLPGKAFDWGADLISNFIDGVKNAPSAIADAMSDVADTVAEYIHFSEPDVGPLSDFHTYAPDMIKEFANGITRSLPMLESASDKMAAALLPDASTALQGSVGGAVTKNIEAPVTITVYGAQGQNVNELADVIQARFNRAVMNQKAVFA